MEATIILGDTKSKINMNSIKGDLVGVDYGAYICIKEKLPIKYSIGDFDSLTIEQFQQVKKSSNQVIQLNTCKDVTDLEYTLNFLVERQYDEIYLVNPFFGRIDHTFINLLLFKKFFLNKKLKRLIFEGTDYKGEVLIPGKYHISKQDYSYQYLSLIALSTVNNLSSKGLKYQLLNQDLDSLDTFAISNEILENDSILQFTDGVLLVINTQDALSN